MKAEFVRGVWGLVALLAATIGCDRTVIDDSDQPGRVGEGVNASAAEDNRCEERGAMQSCGEAGSVQYCDDLGEPGTDDELQWGPCLASTSCEPGDSEYCFAEEEDDGFGGLKYGCLLQDGIPGWDESGCNTPLVVTFDEGPIEMTPAGASSFDITRASSSCITTDWPTADTPWLAIDLDRSGTIDGGHELFGSGTALDSGLHASNGFAALAELDSNGDGRISALDERYEELVLWSDFDGDRTSTLWELQSLENRGVESIDLAYESGNDCDDRGNCARERSRFTITGGRPATGHVVDLYFACQ